MGIKNMKEEGIDRTRQIYATIINQLIRSEEAQQALDVIEMMRADNFSPLSYMFNDIAAIFEKNGEVDRARELIAQSEQEKEAAINSRQSNRRSPRQRDDEEANEYSF